jgi:meso-butanediol dehydrogenase/(S,S)-butanediol dehydrogenase/diacetyl reductase
VKALRIKGKRRFQCAPICFAMTSESKGVAIVTGSAGGLGKAIVLRLAEDGYDISLNGTSRSQSEMELLAEDVTRKGRKAIVVVGDVTAENDVKNLVDTTVEKFGGLDVVSTPKPLNEK